VGDKGQCRDAEHDYQRSSDPTKVGMTSCSLLAVGPSLRTSVGSLPASALTDPAACALEPSGMPPAPRMGRTRARAARLELTVALSSMSTLIWQGSAASARASVPLVSVVDRTASGREGLKAKAKLLVPTSSKPVPPKATAGDRSQACGGRQFALVQLAESHGGSPSRHWRVPESPGILRRAPAERKCRARIE
jgi:hypothetical protein